MFKNLTKEKLTTFLGVLLLVLVSFNLISPEQKAAIESGVSPAVTDWDPSNLVYSISQGVIALAGIVSLFAKDPRFTKKTEKPE